jgi:predicted  nucleic acid-binding Zn-ribbon protein
MIHDCPKCGTLTKLRFLKSVETIAGDGVVCPSCGSNLAYNYHPVEKWVNTISLIVTGGWLLLGTFRQLTHAVVWLVAVSVLYGYMYWYRGRRLKNWQRWKIAEKNRP